MSTRAILVFAIILAACTGVAPETALPPDDSTLATTTPLPTTSIALDPVAGCEGTPEQFLTDGPLGIVGSPDADAQQIALISLTPIGDCEVLEVALSTEGGAPATSLPLAEVELIAGAGILRIKFDPSVTSTAITDSILEGSLIERTYVVRSLDGSIFVDAHLAASVAARTFAQRNPTRVAVELRPFDAEPSGFPLIGETIVVTGPATKSVEYPIVVTGYARTFEANVIGRLFSSAGAETEAVTTAADYLTTWGEFRLELTEGPGGDVTIFVGEDSPVDGTPIGVEFMVSSG